jgi:hypothetical protein
VDHLSSKLHCGRRGNNTFSVATFKANPDAELESTPEELSWQELMPEACERTLAAEALVAEEPVDLHPRKRTRGRVNYSENAKPQVESSSDEMEDEPKNSRKAGSEQDAAFSSDVDDTEESGNQINYWTEKELKRLEDRLFALGRGRVGMKLFDNLIFCKTFLKEILINIFL